MTDQNQPRTRTTNDQPGPEGGWVAYTPREGVWNFTWSETPEQAFVKLNDAIVLRHVLCYPINNPITAVQASA